LLAIGLIVTGIPIRAEHEPPVEIVASRVLNLKTELPAWTIEPKTSAGNFT
jgi:hypothetical protein